MTPGIVQKINKLMATGNFAAAQKHIRSVAKKEPRNAALQNTAGICYAQTGAHQQALPFFAAAVKQNPQNADFRANLALSLIHNTKREQAKTQIKILIELSPQDPRAYFYLAMIAAAEEDHLAAIAHSTKALKFNPRMAEALQLRAAAQNETQNPEAALEDFATVVELKPNDASAQRALARALNETGQFDAALAIYHRVLAIDSDDTFALSQLAANCAPEQLGAIEDQIHSLSSKSLPQTQQRVYHALAQAHLAKRKGHHDEAMQHLSRMHRFDEQEHKWKVKSGWQKLNKLVSTYPLQATTDVLETSRPRPIFIVGLPRSGTTLTETILGAHPDVFACGELRYADIAYRRVLEAAGTSNDNKLSNYAYEYRKMLSWVPSDKPLFTDKMPGNYVYLGPLISAFPNARVIHLRRDPRDVALSMWSRHFPASGMKYTNRLEWIADQANLYKAYMNHWEKSYPDSILSVDYETLVSDLELVSRTLAKHCGLAWSDTMLRPDRAARNVKTASVRQVREKVHKRSVGGWKTFTKDLHPFIDNLDANLWPEIVKQTSE